MPTWELAEMSPEPCTRMLSLDERPVLRLAYAARSAASMSVPECTCCAPFVTVQVAPDLIISVSYPVVEPLHAYVPDEPPLPPVAAPAADVTPPDELPDAPPPP